MITISSYYLCGRGVDCAHHFPCLSYEATKRGQVAMAARVRRGSMPASCGSSTIYRWRDHGYPVKTLPLLLNISCPIPTKSLFYMVRHLADWVAPFPAVSIPLFLSSNSSTLLLHLPPHLLLRARELGCYTHRN